MQTQDVILKILEILDESMDKTELDVKLLDHDNLGISINRRNFVLEMMTDTGLIKGVRRVPRPTERDVVMMVEDLKITLKGVTYLADNTTTAKIIKAAKLIKDVVPMI